MLDDRVALLPEFSGRRLLFVEGLRSVQRCEVSQWRLWLRPLFRTESNVRAPRPRRMAAALVARQARIAPGLGRIAVVRSLRPASYQQPFPFEWYGRLNQ